VSLPTRIIQVSRDEPDPAALRQGAEVLLRGGLVAFATETVYGLGADATNRRAVARIFEAKGRPPFNPLIVHADGPERARACVSRWTEQAEALGSRFWPGPLTLVLPRSESIADLVTAGRDTVGVRVPRPAVARGLIRHAGRPIAAPSANRSSGVSPTEAGHVLNDLDGKIDLVLDSGPTSVGIESTVLDLTGPRPRVLRPGPVTIEDLGEALGIEVLGPGPPPARSPDAISSPGQLAIHYAPTTPTFRVERDDFVSLPGPGRWGVIVIGPPAGSPRVRPPDQMAHLFSPSQAEASLYGQLRAMDSAGLDFLIVVPPPDEPRWLALRDRIWRASRPWPESG
jgi:L-threonylcarbamoyladenylate synthase